MYVCLNFSLAQERCPDRLCRTIGFAYNADGVVKNLYRDVSMYV